MPRKSSTLGASSDIKSGWGDDILELLTEQARSRRWLARACGVDHSTIVRIVAGDLDPNLELKLKIAGALGVKASKLWALPNIVPSIELCEAS